MPVVGVGRDLLLKRLEGLLEEKAAPNEPNKKLDEEFDRLCFEFGVELDDVTSERQMALKEIAEAEDAAAAAAGAGAGAAAGGGKGKGKGKKGGKKGGAGGSGAGKSDAKRKAAEALSNEIIYKIDVPANRYDLLCLEGIARAFRVFRGVEEPEAFHLSIPGSPAASDAEPLMKVDPDATLQVAGLQRLTIKASTKTVRPVCVAAVLRGVTFDAVSYKSFIDLQEKLHQNICRRRELVSVGTHDLDTVEGPFTYEALPPKDIKFAPLNRPDKEMDGNELFSFIDENDRNLKKYLPIIRDSPLYPVVLDKKRRVMSLPPIINGDMSKITLDTKNVFIEVTAIDYTKAKIVLNTICAMFSEYCSEKFAIEPVLVDAEEPGDGMNGSSNTGVYPDLTMPAFAADVDYLNAGCGLDLAPEEQCKLLRKMSLFASVATGDGEAGAAAAAAAAAAASARPTTTGKQLVVRAPITRSDILHQCDVQEDLAIAYGYNNLKVDFPPTLSHGKQQPLNKLTDLLRREVALVGFNEALTLSLCSREDIWDKLRRPQEPDTVVQIANPQTLEFQVCRNSLLPGLLKTVHHNSAFPPPLRIFEISDVVLRDDTKDTGSRNARRAAAVYSNKSAGLEHIHGLVDRIMQMQRVGWEGQSGGSRAKHTYRYEPCTDDPAFLPSHCAAILLDGVRIGVMGIIHPEVLGHFRIGAPCSACELDIEPFLKEEKK